MYSVTVLLLHVFLQSAIGCSPENARVVHLNVYDDVIINTYVISQYTGVSLRAECVAKCGLHFRCLSFFYNQASSTCQIHNALFIEPTGTTSVGTKYYWISRECYVGSSIGGGPPLYDPTGVSPATGGILETSCGSCRVPEDQATCLIPGGQVTYSSCRRPYKCIDVKTLEPSSPDGEYWLYPPVYTDQKVKIYCHGMTTNSPSEYLSLEIPNHGHYPALQNTNCGGEAGAMYNEAGDTTYTKVRVNTQTMTIDKSYRTFASSTNAIKGYGEASDCYTNHGGEKAWCGPKGTFYINTVNTGLRIPINVHWQAYGWLPWGQATRSNDGLAINLLCGGLCGHCSPTSPLALELYPSQEPDLASATMFPCD